MSQVVSNWSVVLWLVVVVVVRGPVMMKMSKAPKVCCRHRSVELEVVECRPSNVEFVEVILPCRTP